MNTKHTPGPWHLGKRAAAKAIYGDKGEEVCQMLGHFNADDENLANARLIAAAPELLEALQVIASQSLGDDWTAEQAITFVKEHARSAIAKATGGKE